MSRDAEGRAGDALVETAGDGPARDPGIRGPGYQLRVLAGRHSGAVMPLPPGRYSLGQDEESDFIFLDDAFLGGQVILDVSGPLPMAAATGLLKAFMAGQPLTPEGRVLEAYQDVEVGATRFAIGPADAPWPAPERAPERAAGTEDRDGSRAEPRPGEGDAPQAPGGPAAGSGGQASDPHPLPASAPAPAARPSRLRKLFVLLPAACMLAALGLAGARYAWRANHPPPDPVLALRGVLGDLGLAEVEVQPEGKGFLLKGFLQTEAEREALALRIKDFAPPVRTRLISAEETRASIQGVLDTYHMEYSIRTGARGKVSIAGVCDDPRLAREIAEAVRQGVQAETEVETSLHPSGDLFSFLQRLLAANLLDHKVSLEVERGRLHGLLVRNQMDSAEMESWKRIQASFRGQFGMDLDEKWTDRLSPALLRLSAVIRDLDAHLVGITMGKLAYISLRDRRKYFEGARFPNGVILRTIHKDRIVLNLGKVEQNYYLKKGLK